MGINPIIKKNITVGSTTLQCFIIQFQKEMDFGLQILYANKSWLKHKLNRHSPKNAPFGND